MNIDLKEYQEIAVDQLIEAVKALLQNYGTRKLCVFKAPTGSGKTVMTAKFIEGLIKELPEDDVCFLWVSIGKGELHLQSKRSLERIFGGFPRVSLVEEEFSGGRERIVKNEVVVVNWEKLRSKDRSTLEWKNILMRDGERVNFREVLERTREERKIVLIIDESHIGATAERTNELRDEINADVVLEMSATPKFEPTIRELGEESTKLVYVKPDDVISEEMIKKEIIINERIAEITESESDSQEIVLEAAFRKRNELKSLFEKENSNINPLVMIQIPVAEAGEDKIRAVREFLSTRNISEANGKLAIWLAEQKSDSLDSIAEPDNQIEFLIFKQAVDTGWDCPRAHILIKFRETRSETFEIQTVGRILRMPELKHYSTEDLNRGYIFTNIQSIIVKKEEYNPNIIKHLKALRVPNYKPLDLVSYYKARIDYGDITSSFSPIFDKIACDYFGLEQIPALFTESVERLNKIGVSVNIEKYQQEIIRDARLAGKTFDDLEGKIDSEMFARLTIAGNDLQALFEQVIKNNLGSFGGVKRSIPVIKTAIYSWFRKYLGSSVWPEEIILIQKIFVNNGNREHFEKILLRSIETYKAIKQKEVKERVEESEKFYPFQIQEESFYNEYADEIADAKNYVYAPCFLDTERRKPEQAFEKFVNTNSKKISWWWKNGEKKQTYFGIKYEYPEEVIHTFYPDYLVMFINGSLGIFEAKDENDRDGASSTKAKAEALAGYIRNHDKTNLPIFGGIVIEKDDGWRINQKQNYDWDKCMQNNWEDWEKLEF